ncbi:hypothetical protein OG339_31560 [Streptosporangium sp. NBC_01495]|uniref:hypothetical protein n=1 Tax=Streptosporangium sp. NBC_01495 TaxID=2903899 RepID=UPI002E2EC357|nr:hypothetical protein [Streptosporangium sp. NBC_01495]
MTLFEAHIDAIENAAKATIWVCFMATFVLLLTGQVNRAMAIVIAAAWISRATLYHIKETRTRWDDRAAEEQELRREQQRANRERELHLQIRQLQRPEGRGDGSSVGGA